MRLPSVRAAGPGSGLLVMSMKVSSRRRRSSLVVLDANFS